MNKARLGIVSAFLLLTTMPSAAEDAVTKANWLTAEINQRSYQNPSWAQYSEMVSRQGAPASELVFAPRNLEVLSYSGTQDGRSRTIGFREHLELTSTDAFLVMHDGKVVYERYFGDMAPYQRHIMMSVTKSFTGTLVAMLVDEGKIDENEPITTYIPELAGTVYEPITVRQLLDMRTGVDYSENYADPDADVWKYISAIGLLPEPEGYDGPRTIHAYLESMEKAAEPGEDFTYVTPITEVLVWLVTKVGGQPYIDTLSDRVWSKLGMDYDAQFLTEASNQPLGGSGLVATARDLARFGQMLLQGGTYNGRQILSPAVAAGFSQGGDRKAFEEFAKGAPFQKGFSYRDQWWVTHNEHGAYSAMGVYGQYLYIDPKANMAIVKQSSMEAATTEFSDYNDFPFFMAVAKYLMSGSSD